jgi:hypothetical protein
MRLLLLMLMAGCWLPAQWPEASISNGLIQAKLYLPDAAKGYYRGTRFDWSGQIASLQYKGHEYFGQWFEKYSPTLHDAIMGPVEEFRTGASSLGYDEAKPGGTFIRIGVGAVRKPEERQFRQFNTYEMADYGKWNTKSAADRVEFTHELKDDNGYAYVYRKTVRLVKNRPQLLIEHSLKNNGRKVINTDQYNHNFFVMDNQPTGTDSVVKFVFEPRATRDLKGAAKVGQGQLVYLRELQKGESVFTEIEGFGGTAKDYDIRMENSKAGMGVRITGDQPLLKIVYWSIRTTFCPEPYIQMRIEPGKQHKWTIGYEFYTLP